MKNLIIFAAVATSLFFQSCVSIAPSVPSVIIPQQKGEINISGSIGLPNVGANASVALSKNFAIVGSVNGASGIGTGRYNRIGYEAGIQCSKFITDKVAISATPSLGYGTFTNPRGIIIPAETIKGNWTAQSLFVQSQYFIENEKNNKFSIGGGLRTAYYTQLFDDKSLYEKPLTKLSVEPILMLVSQHKNFGMFMVAGVDIYSHNEAEEFKIRDKSPFLLTVGVNFKLDTSEK
jgi:hypothetical protein